MGKHIMYRQLQKKGREYIIEYLCQISDKWKFDIDTTNVDEPIIVGYGPGEVIIRTIIEKFHWDVTNDLLNAMAKKYGIGYEHIACMSGCILLKRMFDGVFSIYGVNVFHGSPSYPDFEIKSRNEVTIIASSMWVNINNTFKSNSITPRNIIDYDTDKKIISPILLLLDPIVYFKKYSDVIERYPIFKNLQHTWGIYELLLEYFPEMNGELFSKYLVSKYVFQDVCADIVFLVGRILCWLYMC